MSAISTSEAVCPASVGAHPELHPAAPAAGKDQALFSFRQPVPIPSYLMALVVGLIEAREIGPRSKVWAEKGVVEKAAFEFSETEQFLSTAESIAGPYVWGRYDVVVLPPGFPYGGMENPCLTFVTPTLLAGDRSLANVVAHEIAHSWSGNLVTNSFWDSFWLNEGFTVLLERKIAGRLYGTPHFDFEALIGLKALEESVCSLGKDCCYTALRPNLEGVDPDDVFSSVPYEKGFNFLVYLERLVGGPVVFEAFLKHYFSNFKYRSISTDDFRSFFEGYFTGIGTPAATLASVDWDCWMNEPGMPKHANVFDTSLSEGTATLAQRWKAGGAGCGPEDIKGWGAREKVMFLERVQEFAPVSAETIDAMDKAYGFSAVGNAEIKFRWQMLRLLSNDQRGNDLVADFLGSQGRMKFVRPLYRQLAKINKPFAQQTFDRFKASYHPIASKMVAKDLA